MKKQIVKLCLCLVTVIGLLRGSSMKVLATSLDDVRDDIYEVEVDEEEVTRYVPCPVGPGKHIMRPKGFGALYQGPPSNCTLLFRMGAVSQCQYCYLVVVSEADPDLGLLGRYAFDSPGYELSKNGTVVYKNANEIHYNSSLRDDSLFDGFEWSKVR